MNVKKNVKKVFAMATGVALMGATMAGALAYDLSDYPQPFVDKDEGTFDGAIVVGEDAATADVVGAIDIAASLQAQATKEVTVEGSSSVSVEGGEEIET
ncbi:MAG: S-layer protein, partial [Candidatus Woesearchaeota archaeon]